MYGVGPLAGAAVAAARYKVIIEGALDFSDDLEETRDAAAN